MRYNTQRWWLGELLIGAAVVLLVASVFAITSSKPLTINQTVNETTVHLSANRDQTLFPNDCITLSWNLEHIQAVYLNEQGRPGTGQESFCGTEAVFNVHLPDESIHVYTLTIDAWFASAGNRALIWLASGLAVVGLGVWGWLPGIERIRADGSALVHDIKNHVVSTGDGVHWMVLLVIVLAGVIARLIFLSHEMWIDEVETFNHYVSQSLYGGISSYNDPNNHLLNTLLMHISYKLFGAEPEILRLPALITGILTIPALYGVARMAYNRHTALIAAALVAPHWFLVFMSVNARGYSIQTLLFLIALAAALYVLRGENVIAWTVFAVSSALGFFALPTMLYGFAGIVVWLFLSFLITRQNSRRRMLNLILFSGLTLWLTFALYSPTLARHGLRPITDNQYVQSLTWEKFVDGLPDSLESIWNGWQITAPAWLPTLLLVGCASSILLHTRIAARQRFPLAVPLAGTALVIVSIQQVIPYGRVWTYYLPITLMLAAAGLTALLEPVQSRWKHSAPIVSVCLMLIVNASTLQPHAPLIADKPYDTFVTQLKHEMRTGDTVVSYNPVYETLVYYFLLKDIRADHFYAGGFDSSGRILIIVEVPQQWDEVLSRVTGAQITPGKKPELVLKHKKLSVYAVTPDLLQSPDDT